MKIPALFTAIFLVCILVSACYYDSEEELQQNGNIQCDTINVTFSLAVKPIMQENCYACHSNTNFTLGGNIKLENYSDVILRLDKIKGAINHSPGFVAMPDGAPKLEACKIKIIEKWIESGSPDN